MIVTIASSKPSIVSQSRSCRCCESISVYEQASINVPELRQSHFEELLPVTQIMQAVTTNKIRKMGNHLFCATIYHFRTYFLTRFKCTNELGIGFSVGLLCKIKGNFCRARISYMHLMSQSKLVYALINRSEQNRPKKSVNKT